MIAKIEDVNMITFSQYGDDRGHLVVVENQKDIPFDIKRIFYIYGSDDKVVRGKHANINSQFVLINVAGMSKVKVIDHTGKQKIFELKIPHTAIFLPKMIWKEMYDFSKDSVLLCLSDNIYDPKEYIRDFKEFRAFFKNI